MQASVGMFLFYFVTLAGISEEFIGLFYDE